MNKLFLIFVFGLVATGVVVAQSEFRLDFPVEPIAYTIEITPKKTPAPDQPAARKTPVKISVARAGGIQGNTTTWSDGTTSETWIAGKLMMEESPEGRGIFALDLRSADTQFTAEEQVNRITRPGVFSWAGPKTYAGDASFRDKNAVLFKQGAPEANLYADPTTKRPLALDEGGFVYAFTFDPSPAQKLDLPAKFKDRLNLYLRDMPVQERAAIMPR